MSTYLVEWELASEWGEKRANWIRTWNKHPRRGCNDEKGIWLFGGWKHGKSQSTLNYRLKSYTINPPKNCKCTYVFNKCLTQFFNIHINSGPSLSINLTTIFTYLCNLDLTIIQVIHSINESIKILCFPIHNMLFRNIMIKQPVPQAANQCFWLFLRTLQAGLGQGWVSVHQT